ncbi:hypothetical protein TSUD_46690 [Trifolium subterraneum]|nr:hypothetical protein TSUD_46690 [Trifolium subterraneum]
MMIRVMRLLSRSPVRMLAAGGGGGGGHGSGYGFFFESPFSKLYLLVTMIAGDSAVVNIVHNIAIQLNGHLHHHHLNNRKWASSSPSGLPSVSAEWLKKAFYEILLGILLSQNSTLNTLYLLVAMIAGDSAVGNIVHNIAM